MIHDRHGARGLRPPARAADSSGSARRWARAIRSCAALLALLSLAACSGDTGISVEALRFGQLGEIEVHLQVPLRGNTLADGQPGPDCSGGDRAARGPFRRPSSTTTSWGMGTSFGIREALISSPADYASLITQVNDQQGLQLDVAELPQDTVPDMWTGADPGHLHYPRRPPERGQELDPLRRRLARRTSRRREPGRIPRRPEWRWPRNWHATTRWAQTSYRRIPGAYRSPPWTAARTPPPASPRPCPSPTSRIGRPSGRITPGHERAADRRLHQGDGHRGSGGKAQRSR